MDKSTLVKLLLNLNGNFGDGEDVEEQFQQRFEEIAKTLTCSASEILNNNFFNVNVFDKTEETYEWKYICLNFHILDLLNSELSKSDKNVLSVQETKNAKVALENLMLHGILKNLQPNLPHHVKSKNSKDQAAILYKYNLLKCTVDGFVKCMQYPNLKMLLLPNCLQGILVAALQVAHCPLKQPGKSAENAKFIMTEETYLELLEDQKLFKEIVEEMRKTIHPAIFIKETMVLFQANAPIWFKKAISSILTKMMRGKNGIRHLTLAMLDASDDDTTKSWKTLEVLTKLIMSCRNFADFKENICVQVLNLLGLVRITDRELLIFERLVVSCTKSLYSQDEELCKSVFVKRIMTPLLYFACKEHKFRDGDDVTDDLKQTVRLIHGCFADNAVNLLCLPTNLLKTLINVTFHFYHLTVKTSFRATNKELREVLIKYLQNSDTLEIYQLLDNFLFGFTVTNITQMRDDVIVEVDEKIVVKNSAHSVIYATADVIDTVFNLLDTEQKIVLFGYLLKCITDREKYFPASPNSKELLGDEDHATGTVLERLLTIYKLLTQLSENKDVQDSLRNKPDAIIEYIKNVLSTNNTDSQLIFIVLMILDNLTTNASVDAIPKYKLLIDSLTATSVKLRNPELNSLCTKIITKLNEDQIQESNSSKETEFDKALEDVYDPLLPTRGHGLLVLSKLIEKKDKQAMERKQYLLNLFQLYLKDEDSFIYLNAVQGLAALSDQFPDTILETLCEEYADLSKKTEGAQETRMKLGEVLVRVVKLLGEMAPKYKSLLLNTFLSVTKDDDHLIRSSSLSNLGEVCRVLNYKLGSIVTEVLVCVHAIITTDRAVEARRAAVTVIRQLFVGLQSEMIAFLKEDILPVYRTLKDVYYNDKDDVMRLQAQLALEELNENMKNFVLPNPQLHHEKKIIMLN